MSKMLKVLKVLKVLIEHLASLTGWYSSCGGETSVTSRQVLRLWSDEPRYCPKPLPGERGKKSVRHKRLMRHKPLFCT
jgi:hypothetical protein